MKCRHETTTRGDPYPFVGSVAVRPYTDENPMAHGGCVYLETCTACGARRSEAANGSHAEYSPWGPDRAARQVVARRAHEAVQRAPWPDSLTVRSPDRRGTALVSIEVDGHILISYGRDTVPDDAAVLGALPPEFIEAAKQCRQAVLDAESADRDVE